MNGRFVLRPNKVSINAFSICDAGFRALVLYFSKLDERTKFSESFYCGAVFYADDIGEGCFFGYFFVCLRRYLFFCLFFYLSSTNTDAFDNYLFHKNNKERQALSN